MKRLYTFLILLFIVFIGKAQIINFPDAQFKARLLTSDTNNVVVTDFSGNFFHLDVNNDGQIQVSEALLVKEMNVGGQNGSNMYSNMGGIEYFTNMISLKCWGNPITSLNVSGLPQLKELNCWGTELTSLNLTNLINLEKLYCGGNPQLTNLTVSSTNIINHLSCDGNNLTTLNLSLYPHLKSLDCGYNQLTSLDVSGLPNFEDLRCYNNQLSSLNISGLVNLKYLNCSVNPQLPLIDFSLFPNLEGLSCSMNPLQNSLNVTGLTNLKALYCSDLNLTSLDLSTNLLLERFYCVNNQLTTLELTNHTNLHYLDCSNNLLNTLFIKGATIQIMSLDDVFFANNPNLSYICANDTMLDYIQYRINSYNYSNCFVNSYCSFTPSGTYYTIQGSNKYDEDSNGCSPSDINYPFLKLFFSNGTSSGNLISNDSGNYTIPVQGGTHTITPVLENPSYFNISPSTTTVTFPTETSPFDQNFCIASNGTHNDLEVFLIPLNVCRPGFDVRYKIVCKNKGTNSQSGSVTLNFDDAILDYISATPALNSQMTNNLSWNFINLAPFESREIQLTLHLNGPTEVPSVDGGSILNYTTTISGLTDETPDDNVAIFNQKAVNSYDPNDKTCLEGAVISPSVVGEYVHYFIRFENTGTANAVNIVLKDIIDSTKFDINSLLPINGSHNFVTRIVNTNKVEFIFENINLPFDDANNDGYVAFKIKTKPTLIVGDTFSNTANIYFDYNAPIVTNTAITTVTTLGTTDFDFNTLFSLSPVPAKNELTITSKQSVTISSISIYNMLGQLVEVVTNPANTIDVTNLKAGNYFIKIISDKGTTASKFIKE
ncbi:DUF7619 domain-containing protein [Flavobacterium phycosphaerae]|uniref:DUF7619 domain-containing protein n=1 Tax=Flavobacterium phycosphaerae TaxID=2697515 RepID=UPI001389541F|nr:T9SS type A sorting domain-containing protein [Flavobacterium phycosphaerae]